MLNPAGGMSPKKKKKPCYNCDLREQHVEIYVLKLNVISLLAYSLFV